MSAKAITEYDGKRLLAAGLAHLEGVRAARSVQVVLDGGDHAALLDSIAAQHPWLHDVRLVAKPDQLLKRRGKSGLLLLDASWAECRAWVLQTASAPVSVDSVTGTISTFIIEPFIQHRPEEEYYVCIRSVSEGDEILLAAQGGVDVGDVDAHGKRVVVTPLAELDTAELAHVVQQTFAAAPPANLARLARFVEELYRLFVTLQFTYLEINPLVQLASGELCLLDLAAKLDQTAEYECAKVWGGIAFPAPFGRKATAEERYISELDGKTGASLKLTVLNGAGRIWTMVAGGGASVAYSDAIAALGFAHELANYGEYSGAPSEAQTYEYAKTVLDLMTRGAPRADGKVLFIGGGIANFTNVAATFKGIIKAVEERANGLAAHRVSIYIRRGGPNYQEGLSLMRELGARLALPIHVFGPETHITAIVPMALSPQLLPVPDRDGPLGSSTHDLFARCFTPVVNGRSSSPAPSIGKPFCTGTPVEGAPDSLGPEPPAGTVMHPHSRALVFGMQPKAVQGMLDFDFISRRARPSVAGMCYPFGGDHVQRFYWGTRETLIPVYADIRAACKSHPHADWVINFSSCRSVYDSCHTIITACPQIRHIAVIAEGVPERYAKRLRDLSRKHGVTIIGAATVGGLRAGAFKIGNTGGMIDNIISSKLYRPGSVSYVSKSGGMSNELNNIISRATDGVLEGVAIGGDRFPCSSFLDHILRFEQDPDCKIIVLLGEVGGLEEYAVIEAVRDGRVTKPVVAWCLGICADMFSSEVQFGHAGAFANSTVETSRAKNAAMRAAGILVPESFEAMPELIERTFSNLVDSGFIVIRPEPEVPKMPIDYAWAQELGLIRKPPQFVSTICDDRGQELLYAGMPISAVFRDDIGIGGVLSLLWFKRRLPDWACKFIEMTLMITADHGPAVSGAHNTIVTARAGKDLVSSLASGLLTIGERFGGALDGAAQQFSAAFDHSWSPQDFVANMRKQNQLIMGIGHKIKSKTNPDLRVSILTEYAQGHFPSTPLLDYALRVEEVTTQKKESLILNVDGAIAVLFVDLLRNSGAFTREEADEYIKIGTLNGMFVLGRSIGFIGHYLDQKRLKQGLYRHPWDDISYRSTDTYEA